MSDKYIMALYTHCLVMRKEAILQEIQIAGFTEKEYGMVRLENVGGVLFQALLFDIGIMLIIILNITKRMNLFAPSLLISKFMEIQGWMYL